MDVNRTIRRSLELGLGRPAMRQVGTTPWAVHDNFETSAKARFRRNIPTNTSKLCYGYGNCPYRERRKDLCREGVGGISPRDAFQQMFPPEGWVLTARVSQTLSVDVSGVVTD